MMKVRVFAVLLSLVVLPAAVQAQSIQQSSAAAPSLREQLMPTSAAMTLTAPIAQPDSHAAAIQPAAFARHSGGTPYMIAGAALFAAGIIAGGGAGTVLVLAGAGIGAYGLYLHFT